MVLVLSVFHRNSYQAEPLAKWVAERTGVQVMQCDKYVRRILYNEPGLHKASIVVLSRWNDFVLGMCMNVPGFASRP